MAKPGSELEELIRIKEHSETQSDVRKPRMYRVLLINDDYTPMEFVIEVLRKFFKKNEAEAVEIMLNVHHQGVGVAGLYQYDIAETKVHQVNSYAQKNLHPLKSRLEPE